MASDLRPTRKSRATGFTLVELVLAVAIIGGAFLSILYLRASAVSRTTEFTKARHIQRLAQEKLDEVIFGFEEETEGAFEREQDGTWVVEIEDLGEPSAPLYACTIIVEFPQADGEPGEPYELRKWVSFIPEESILQNYSVDNLLDEPGQFR